MKILYIGNDSIDNVVDAVTKRYSSLDVLVAKSMEQAMYLATRGDAIDRVILLDTVFTSALDIANTQKLRLAVQKLIGTLKEGNITEIVCIAQTETTGGFFLEELYEIMYNSAVFIVGKQLLVTDILAYSVQSIAQLRQTSRKTVSTDVYQTDESVIWSDSKAIMSEWQQLERQDATQELIDKFRLNLALEILEFWLKTGRWEYKLDLIKDEITDSLDKAKDLTGSQGTGMTVPKVKKPNIFVRIINRFKSKTNRA